MKMGSVGNGKAALILCGEYMEDYEVMVPFQVLQAFGVTVHCVSPGKPPGHKCLTAVHDYMGFQLYTELQGHTFTLNSNFDDVKPESYDALIVPGGRFTEPLSADPQVLSMVSKFAAAGKPIATSCHSQLLLVSTGLLKGRKCTAFPSMKPVMELAGGVWSDQLLGTHCGLPIPASVLDGNILTSIGWPAHADYLHFLLGSMGATILRSTTNNSVLFLCGDYVEDYEINVPFRALGGLGCKVDAVSPGKKKGESCVTAIFDDDMGAAAGDVCTERRGHNFAVTADWDDVSVDDYDCVVVPGGRSPEWLILNDKAIPLVVQFARKDKVVAAIGQGTWLLAVAGLLKDKRCAGSLGMQAIIKAAGGEVEKSTACSTHGKLITATGWLALPTFISQLSHLLGFSVVF
ncbi:DJ-1 protein homolog E-like [Malania oleifera]|uniref:DJ-1 protein homolog E-like n=1 Tax=Malania oleifera TaxID=397392 RepID=UPI0025AE945F|nr:DJ-1 protein homolog E-like [Malania oleifera]